VSNSVTVLVWLAALISAAVGLALAVRRARSTERLAAQKELAQVEAMLATERHGRVIAELTNYQLVLLLAQHGIEVPPPAEDEDS
jgi:hypothetical protein